MIEYLVGGSKPKQTLTPNSVPTSSILFSENYSKIIFHMYKEDNTNNLSAIEIDNDVIIGTKNPDSKSIEIIFKKDDKPSLNGNNMLFSGSSLEFPKRTKNYFDSMEIQEVIKQACDNKYLYWSSITYFRINYNNQEYILGEKKPVGMVKLNDANNILLEYDFLEPIIINKPFFISGLISHNANICSIQIIELNSEDINTFQNEIFYNRGSIGIIEGKSDTGDFELKNMIMNHNIITIENMKPNQLLYMLHERMGGWTYDKSVISTYYPKFLSLIDEAMIEREFDVIHSVMRLDRYLKSLIQRENFQLNSHKKYQLNLELAVKLYNVWKPLNNSMKLIQKIHDSDIELNCYQVAYLSKSKKDLVYAITTIICQIGLLILLGLSLLEVNIDNIFPLLEGRIIIPIIFIFTQYIVQKQISNTLIFMELFPKVRFSFLGICDLFSNVVAAGLIVLLNFFVLAFSDSLMDIVLNSLAALFIIELDDNMVFISSNAKDDLYKQKVVSFFNESIKNIDDIYFSIDVWKHQGVFKLKEDYEVDRELCTIIKKNNTIVPDTIEVNNV